MQVRKIGNGKEVAEALKVTEIEEESKNSG